MDGEACDDALAACFVTADTPSSGRVRTSSGGLLGGMVTVDAASGRVADDGVAGWIGMMCCVVMCS